MPPTTIINVHTHIHRHQDIDARVALWRASGVVKVCVQAAAPPEGRGWQFAPWANCKPAAGTPILSRRQAASGRSKAQSYDNEGVLEWMRRHPDIIVGFGYVELGPEVDPPEQIDRLKEQGFTGLKFIAPSEPYDHERYYPLYERAQALAMPILFHTGFLAISPSDGARRVSTDKMRAMRLDPIGRAFPDLRMIMAHLGNPEFHVGLSILMDFANIYGEFSGASGSKWRETALRKVFAPLPGADLRDEEENQALRWFTKLCFATDNPEPPRWIDLSQRLMDELELPQELQERFWWRNAAEVLRLDEV